MEFSLIDILLYTSSDVNFTGDFLLMENNDNTSGFNSSGGGNPTGGTPGDGPPGGGPSHDDIAAATSADDYRVRRSNPMSLTQMCTGTDIEPNEPKSESPVLPEPLSKQSLKKVSDVLSEQRDEF